MKFVPVIVTVVPGGPESGENDEIVGGGDDDGTMKSLELVAVPPAVATVILPFTAPWGTAASIRVVDTTL